MEVSSFLFTFVRNESIPLSYKLQLTKIAGKYFLKDRSNGKLGIIKVGRHDDLISQWNNLSASPSEGTAVVYDCSIKFLWKLQVGIFYKKWNI